MSQSQLDAREAELLWLKDNYEAEISRLQL